MDMKKINKLFKIIYKYFVLFIIYNIIIFLIIFFIYRSKYAVYAKNHPAYNDLITFIESNIEIRDKLLNIKEIKYKAFSTSCDDEYDYMDFSFILIGEKSEAKLFARTRSKKQEWEIEKVRLCTKDGEIFVK